MIPVLPLIRPNRNEKIENQYPLQKGASEEFYHHYHHQQYICLGSFLCLLYIAPTKKSQPRSRVPCNNFPQILSQ